MDLFPWTGFVEPADVKLSVSVRKPKKGGMRMLRGVKRHRGRAAASRTSCVHGELHLLTVGWNCGVSSSLTDRRHQD